MPISTIYKYTQRAPWGHVIFSMNFFYTFALFDKAYTLCNSALYNQ